MIGMMEFHLLMNFWEYCSLRLALQWFHSYYIRF